MTLRNPSAIPTASHRHPGGTPETILARSQETETETGILFPLPEGNLSYGGNAQTHAKAGAAA
jgi:hypothetical protein